jgi:hypothetical protein
MRKIVFLERATEKLIAAVLRKFPKDRFEYVRLVPAGHHEPVLPALDAQIRQVRVRSDGILMDELFLGRDDVCIVNVGPGTLPSVMWAVALITDTGRLCTVCTLGEDDDRDTMVLKGAQ